MAQKEAEALLEFHGRSTEQGFDGIALRAFEAIALQSLCGLHPHRDGANFGAYGVEAPQFSEVAAGASQFLDNAGLHRSLLRDRAAEV